MSSNNHSDKTTRLLTQLRSPPQTKEQRTAVGTGLFLPNHSGVTKYINERTPQFEHIKIVSQTALHALNVTSTQTATENSTAANINSVNVESSAMWLSGYEKDRGTLKITHNYPGVSDANAAAISINLADATSAARGIFLDTDGGTGDFIYLRNNGNIKFRIDKDGVVICTTLQPSDGATGSFTTADAKTVTVTNGIITSIV